MRERLDEGDPRVGHVVVGPLRAALLDQTFGVVHQVLEAAVVQIRCRQHGVTPFRRTGRTTTAPQGRWAMSRGRALLGNDVEREHQIAWVVAAPDHVPDVDEQRPRIGAVEVDPDIEHVDAGLPLFQRGPDLVGDRTGGRGVDRIEDVVTDPAAELRSHRTLTRSGAEDDPYRLGDLSLTPDHGDAAGRVHTQRI